MVAMSAAVVGRLWSNVSSEIESTIERAFIPCSASNGDIPVIELGVWFQHADISGVGSLPPRVVRRIGFLVCRLW